MDRLATDVDAAKAPHSPYAAELQRGRVSLRFPALLEREFRRSHLERVRSRARAWQVALLLLGIASLVVRYFSLGPFKLDAESLVRVGVLVPTCLLMTYIAWSRHYERSYLLVSFIGSILIGVLAAAMIAKAVVSGRAETLTFLTTNMMATFFLVGLLFFDAFLACLLSLMAFAVAGVVFGMPLDRLLYDSMLLGTVTLVSASVAYGIEETNRRFFLERGVLGDLAERDGLTGLRNRRAFDEHLVKVWQQSLRDRSSLSILMIDLDHFKDYNDHYGHQAGDHCLRHVAQVVQRFARRPLDIAARYGGEELAVVLYQVTAEQAKAIAEQLRATLAAARIEHRGSPMHGIVTVSIGVAWVEATLDRSPQETVKIADEALYTAKQEGRNQTFFLGPDHAHGFTGTLRLAPRYKPGR